MLFLKAAGDGKLRWNESPLWVDSQVQVLALAEHRVEVGGDAKDFQNNIVRRRYGWIDKSSMHWIKETQTEECRRKKSSCNKIKIISGFANARLKRGLLL